MLYAPPRLATQSPGRGRTARLLAASSLAIGIPAASMSSLDARALPATPPLQVCAGGNSDGKALRLSILTQDFLQPAARAAAELKHQPAAALDVAP